MKAKAFSLVEMLVVVAILVIVLAIALTLGIILPSLGTAREIAHRSVSGANMRGIFQSMYTYSVTQGDWFPVAGNAAEGDITGFKAGSLRGQTDVKPDDPNMINNGTASLWLLVRDGSINSNSFINPSTEDKKDEQKDASGKPVTLSETWDFFHADDNKGHNTLSYSFINMYHKDRKRNWNGETASSWVLMGDNNNADETVAHKPDKDIHSLTNAMVTTPAQITESENSTNHSQEGQNLLFGDGHIEFNNHPFVGPKSDNVYAKDTSTDDPDSGTYTEKSAPPTLDCTDEWTQPERDVMLIPLTGNNGQNISDSK